MATSEFCQGRKRVRFGLDDSSNRPSKMERPKTPSPDSIREYEDTNTSTIDNPETGIPYSEMEPLDQMIFDLEAERSSPPSAPYPDSEDEDSEYSDDEEDVPYDEMDPLEQEIFDLEAEAISQQITNYVAQKAVNVEFDRRSRLSRVDKHIHHYNWFGKAIYGSSSTPPAISLAIIMSEPKVTDVYENTRVHAILNRAYLYIDPIIIDFDVPNGSNIMNLLQRRSNLEQTMKNHAIKFYTPHGSWISEIRSVTDEIGVDDGNIANYAQDYGIGNGFFTKGYINSWSQWKENYYRAEARENELARGRQHRKRVSYPSPLRQVMTVETEELPVRDEDKYSRGFSNRTGTLQRVNRSCQLRANDPLARGDVDWDTAVDPATYYSLPFAEPLGRRKSVKGTLQKASKSALSYLTCGTHR